MAAFADIVNHYIERTVIHFGERPQRPEDYRVPWQRHQEHYPWLVADDDGTVGGLAYGRPWNERPAYDWTVETTIYLRDGLQGRGLGSLLYGRLLALLDAQGYRQMVAGITLPNPASVALHEACGYRRIGTLDHVGFKQGAWWDVGLWQRHVASGSTPDPPGSDAPAPVRRVSEVEEPLD